MGKISAAIAQVRGDNRVVSSDIILTDRYIWNKLKTTAFVFIKQKNDKFNLNNNNFLYSTLECVEMELVPSTDCCIDLPTCSILRSKEPIPKIVESNLSAVLKGIYNLDGTERIDFITKNDAIKLGKSKYAPQGIKAYIQNDYLYIPFRDTPKAVAIEALFENPEEVYFLNGCTKKDYCTSPQDMEWRVPSDLEAVVIEKVVQNIFNFHHRIVPDENTNKNETIK